MKHSLLFLSLLSLLFLGSCASDDALTELTQDPEPDVPTIPFTGTITSGDGPSAVAQALVADDGPFHALSDEGTTLKATWEVGDEMALIVNGTLCKATVSEVNGNKANISANVPATVSDGAEARLIYPYSAVDAETLEVKSDLLSEQDGSLATIAKNLDVCKGSGVLSVANGTAKLKADVTMAEQYCIWRLATQYNGSALSITKLTIAQGSDTYTVNLSSAASSGIYVALKPAASTAYNFQAFPENGARYLKDYASVTLAAQKFYRSTLNLDFDEFWFVFPTYYMWDAKQWYWYGVDDYPTIINTVNYNIPFTQSDDPLRWYNTVFFRMNSGDPSLFAASNSAKDMPNVNDFTWYVNLGDPHWDAAQEWYLGGQKYTAGLWLKKKSVIKESNTEAFTIDKAYDGTDWRLSQKSIEVTPTVGRPSNISDYFFLPTLGNYVDGEFWNVGRYGQYWSSSPYPDPSNYSSSDELAYRIGFKDGNVNIYGNYSRVNGFLAGLRPDGTPWFK